MNILLIGSGGREHALAWKLAQSPLCHKLYAAPGNPGIAGEAELVALDATDHAAIGNFCREKQIGLVVIGPEGPLVDGLGDYLRAADIPVFGPDKAAARLEGSKGFTKDLCTRANIPTAAYARHDNAESALADLPRFGLPVVIKADGLAAGKGVIIAKGRAEAEEAVRSIFGGSFGQAGAQLVIEEFMTGEEASFFALTDGRDIISFGSAQDHKAVGDGDIGPNTGGMGAYSPAPIVTPAIEAEIMEKIIRPTVQTLAAENMPYCGVLFAGLMLTAEGPKLIEYNCRFGDPECQVLMSRFQGDLAALMLAVATGALASAETPELDEKSAITVVMAAKGYPGTPEKGGHIRNIDQAEAQGVKIFHAGTAMADGELVANGGRVLNITAMADTVSMAQTMAYRAIDRLDFPDGFCRHDIGWREIAREKEKDGAG